MEEKPPPSGHSGSRMPGWVQAPGRWLLWSADKPMSTTQPAEVSSIASRTIEPGRFDRAVTEPMDAERVCDRMYRVTHDGGIYDVDLESGCSCPDHEYRGDQYVCKHVIRAALVEVFANTASTELVARVAAHAREHGCPVDGHGGQCPGPLGGTRTLPCPTCCDAVRSDGVDSGAARGSRRSVGVSAGAIRAAYS